ncbi:NADPH:quinone reductase-like Zn-dependent oxidoreductase [Burkholderia sp. PvR073]|uniref:hypothetical protein n=1 Tax=Burkholderia ambifaria TaxID=152480 RepID=UPI00254F5FD8|nr:hypothetical protein [Burkholderia sp. lyk4-R2A-23]
MTMNPELQGKRVLVTAGTKGIGKAVVGLFHELGVVQGKLQKYSHAERRQFLCQSGAQNRPLGKIS